MSLLVYPPALVQAPARAGVGLEFREREALPWWPADWWQRNYDVDVDAPDPLPLTARERRIPPPQAP